MKALFAFVHRTDSESFISKTFLLLLKNVLFVLKISFYSFKFINTNINVFKLKEIIYKKRFECVYNVCNCLAAVLVGAIYLRERKGVAS